MKNILKVLFGTRKKPVFPLWILIVTFLVSIFTGFMYGDEVSKNHALIGLSFFAVVCVYNVILITLNFKK